VLAFLPPRAWALPPIALKPRLAASSVSATGRRGRRFHAGDAQVPD
jgi:hypothetical protein